MSFVATASGKEIYDYAWHGDIYEFVPWPSIFATFGAGSYSIQMMYANLGEYGTTCTITINGDAVNIKYADQMRADVNKGETPTRIIDVPVTNAHRLFMGISFIRPKSRYQMILDIGTESSTTNVIMAAKMIKAKSQGVSS